MYELKEGQGNLFRNSRKQSQNQPDMTGSVLINGRVMRIAAWTKISGGTANKYLSIQITDQQQSNDGDSARVGKTLYLYNQPAQQMPAQPAPFPQAAPQQFPQQGNPYAGAPGYQQPMQPAAPQQQMPMQQMAAPQPAQQQYDPNSLDPIPGDLPW